MTKGNNARKPDGAWHAEQVVDYAMPRIGSHSFYIICPDNAVRAHDLHLMDAQLITEQVDTPTDYARCEWSMADLLEDRPALSRWHKDYESQFAAHMKEKTGK